MFKNAKKHVLTFTSIDVAKKFNAG